jgi:hypothetical protein
MENFVQRFSFNIVQEIIAAKMIFVGGKKINFQDSFLSLNSNLMYSKILPKHVNEIEQDLN